MFCPDIHTDIQKSLTFISQFHSVYKLQLSSLPESNLSTLISPPNTKFLIQDYILKEPIEFQNYYISHNLYKN